MRNRAVHGYDAIDWEVVYETTMSTCQSWLRYWSPCCPPRLTP